MIRPLITALAVASLATPVMADKLFICDRGGSMKYRSLTREMVISRPGEIDIAIPHSSACTGGRVSGWSPFEDESRRYTAPYVQMWSKMDGVMETTHSLDAGVVVRCHQ